jgi:uncharacterized protein (DUF952 family)
LTDWQKAQDADYYEASSLQTEGFIHCSDKHQIEGVIGRYYAQTPDLMILEINPALLEAELKYEMAPSNEEYPHIFGRINRSAIVSVSAWGK